MKLNTMKLNAGALVLLSGIMASCGGDPNSPGLEYMPDMYRSPSVEAYVDYAEVRGLFRPELVGDKVSLTPPNGTIPYYGTGDVSIMMPYLHGAPIGSDKTHGLYGQRQDSVGYANSALDKNPIPFSEEVLKEGKAIYGLFCLHCHGEKGDGQGPVVVNSLGKFPPPPAYDGALKNLPAGTIFYSVTYGKGMMGSHASQLNKEERWKVVHYVEFLQGKQQGDVVSDSTATTVVPVVDAPAALGE
ncbi:MAG: c-type cytochrome [Crocinitomicaceae bacterium]|jgi:mono/diheme cytochrome c family protein|nr:c-type cytochrome [Crocinitomicaceae bacterium]MBK9590308.1 c-type cytochrome [Crocinitomicaceae bacterium]